MSRTTFVSKRNLWIAIVVASLLLVLLYFRYFTGRRPVVLPESAKMEVEIRRFDQELYGLKGQLTDSSLASLKQAYGDFFKLYVEQLVAVAGERDPELHLELSNFLNDPYIDTVYRETLTAYAQINDVEKELSDAFSYFYYFFPKAQPYEVVAFVSGFQFKNALSDSALLLGLDLHLGSDYKYYPEVSYLTQYLLPRLSRPYLVPDAMKLMVEDLLPPAQASTNVLSGLITAGKVQYALKSILPSCPDSVLFGYSDAQWRWAEQNESDIWSYLLADNMLFSTDVNTISRLMNDGPFTSGLPQESPPRIAAFAGYKLINKFMDRNPFVSLEELFAMDPNELLKKAKYKGKS
jgi:hypothetical protein